MTQIAAADKFMADLGVEAYRVGGSVRDEIIGKRPKDADYMVRGVGLESLGGLLSVSAGERATRIKDRLGQHIGWRVALKNVGLIEVTLPRIEENAGGGRMQKIGVDPGLSLKQDSFRRDFTFNALYRPVDQRYLLGSESAASAGVVDPTGTGIYDLTHRIIRTTHEDSFRDDPLRTLRALRFVSTLNADLAPETEQQMIRHADAVDGWMKGGVSGTVLTELSKLLMGQCPAKALRIARDTGVLAVAFPELAPMLGFDQGSRYHDMTTDEHTFTALETAAHVDAPLRVRMALLFHDAGKPETSWVGKDGRKHYYRPSPKQWEELTGDPASVQEFCDDRPEDHEIAGARIWREAAARLNADKKLRNDVNTLVLNHMVPCEKVKPTKVARARVKFGDDLLRDLYLMRMCDLSGKGSKNKKFLENIALMEYARLTMARLNVPSSIKNLEINGADCHAAGLDGRDIGRALGDILDEVVCDPTPQKLSREWQLARLGPTTAG